MQKPTLWKLNPNTTNGLDLLSANINGKNKIALLLDPWHSEGAIWRSMDRICTLDFLVNL